VIARLEGIMFEQHPTRVVIDVGGVGYDVHIPLSTFTELPDAGKPVALHIHTHANEGALQLFGFASRAERAAFARLVKPLHDEMRGRFGEEVFCLLASTKR